MRTTATPIATWFARYELAWLALAAPLLLFPGWWTWAGLGVIALVWLSRWVALGRLTLQTPMDAPIAILILMVIVGSAASIRPDWSWPRVAGVVLGVAIYYGLVNSVKTEQHLRWLATGLILAGMGYAVVGLLGTDWGRVRLVNLTQLYGWIPTVLHRRAPGPTANVDLLNPRQVAGAVIVLLPIPVTLLLFGSNQRLRLLASLVTVVMVGALMLSQSLPGIIGFGAALAFLAVWRSRRFLLLVPFGFAVLAGVLLAYGPQQAAVAVLSLDNPIGLAVALRLDMWSRALAMMRDMPFTGIGLNTFPLIQYEFYPGFLLGPEPHAHNLFLQTALDLGLPGLLALVGLVAAFTYTAVRAYRAAADRDVKVLLVGLAASILAYLAYGLMDTSPWGSRTQVAFWGVVGSAAAVLSVAGQAKNAPGLAQQTVHLQGKYAIVVAAVILVPLAVLSSGAMAVNVATIQAQRALSQVRSTSGFEKGDLRAVEHTLERAAGLQPGNSHLYLLLGEVYGWLGDNEQAVGAFRRAVEMDSPDPISEYLPSEGLLRRIRGETAGNRWDDAIRTYSQWIIRFPQRTEAYVRVAVIWNQYKKGPARAAAVVRSGLDHRADPQGPLSYYLDATGRGE